MGNPKYESQRVEEISHWNKEEKQSEISIFDLKDINYFLEFVSYNPLKLKLGDDDRINVFIIHVSKPLKVIDVKNIMARAFGRYRRTVNYPKSKRR